MSNWAVRRALLDATAAAGRLGRPAPALWRTVADGLAQAAPRADGVILEYPAYNGHSIKQADTILSFFPLGRELPRRKSKPTSTSGAPRLALGR